MLDFFRNHKRLMMFLLVLVIVPGLGFVGIQGFRNFFDESANVASVNGHKITRVEYDGALREQLDRARQVLGASFDAKTVDTPEMRHAILDGIVQQRVLADETQDKHLTASDEAVVRAEQGIPAIAALRKADGTYDVDQYKQLLAMQGMTPAQFDERVRYQLASRQLPDGIQGTAFAPKALAQQLASLSEQSREVQGLAFRTADYLSKVQPSDAQLKQYYDAHRDAFATPESATIQYVTLSADALANSVQPSDADVKKYYDDNIAKFKTSGEVRASHILVAVPANASAADRDKAKQKAQSLLAQLKAHPDQFAQIAQQNSDDPGSKDKGGDLGFFGPGMMVKSFSDAAFKLKKNEISDVVQSDFGYHIIKVIDIKPEATQPFDQVKASIATQLKNQQAAKVYAEDADAFTNIVYEQANSLKPAVDKFKLPLQTATVTRQPNPVLPPTSPLNNAKFLAAVFADDSIKAKHNTSAIDAGNNTLISARIVDYKPATVQPFDAVKAQVQQKVVAQLAADMARKEGGAKLADVQKSKSTTGFSSVTKVSRADTQGVPPQAIAAIFKADPQKLPAYVGVDLGDGGYAIYRINAVDLPASVDPQRLAGAQMQIGQVLGDAEWAAYLDALRARSRVKIYSTPGASTD
jgi:peptidyl-prolyl cis-trans isomerase D